MIPLRSMHLYYKLVSLLFDLVVCALGKEDRKCLGSRGLAIFKEDSIDDYSTIFPVKMNVDFFVVILLRSASFFYNFTRRYGPTIPPTYDELIKAFHTNANLEINRLIAMTIISAMHGNAFITRCTEVTTFSIAGEDSCVL